jgi:hypothetical protein
MHGVTSFPALLSSLIERPGYDEENLTFIKLVVALVALLALVWEGRAAGRISTRIAKGVACLLAVTATISYFQFFQIGYQDFYHRWELYHRYVGAKYHRELGYELFYPPARRFPTWSTAGSTIASPRTRSSS